MKDKVYYANGDSTTKAGIQKYEYQNGQKIIITCTRRT